jgi:peptidyl-tRNA hydrolase
VETLRLYAIVRNDIGMSPGKSASQAGHAYLGAFLLAQQSRPEMAGVYASDSPGTKVCLQATGPELFKAKLRAEMAGLPVFLVIDSGCPNFFGGEPTPTALGVGPVEEGELPNPLRRLKLL